MCEAAIKCEASLHFDSFTFLLRVLAYHYGAFTTSFPNLQLTNGVLNIIEAIPSQRNMERQQEQKDEQSNR